MAWNEDVSPPPPPRYRILRMLAAYSANICLACGTAVLGPTLVSMGYLLHTDTTHMSLSLSGQRLGYLAGTILCGAYYSRMPILPELQFCLCSLGVAMTMALAAWQQEVYGFIAVLLLMGMSIGYIDAGLQVYVMNLWKGHRSRNSILQSLHFNWSAFSTILPFLISLFLRDIPESHLAHYKGESSVNTSGNISANTSGNISVHSYNHSLPAPVPFSLALTQSQPTSSVNQSSELSDTTNSTLLSGIAPDIYGDASDVGLVRWAYVCLAALAFVNAIYIFVVYLITKASENKPLPQQQQQQQKSPILEEKPTFEEKPPMGNDDANVTVIEFQNKDTPQKYRTIILGFLFLFAFLYQCAEGIPGGFLTAFSAQGLGWHLERGAKLTMAYWGAQGLGRLLSMFLSIVLSPRTLIGLNLTALTSGYLLLQLVFRLGDEWVWVAMVLGGLGLGSSLPSSLLWVSDYMSMTSGVSATALGGSCLAGVLVLPLTGYLFDTLGASSMVYILGLSALLVTATFIAMQLWATYGIRLFSDASTPSEEEEEQMHFTADDEPSLARDALMALDSKKISLNMPSV